MRIANIGPIFRSNGRAFVKPLNKRGAILLLRFLRCRNEQVIDILVVPKRIWVGNHGVVVERRVYSRRLESRYDLPRRANMIAMRVRADIEIKVFAGHTHALHEGNNLVFNTLANSRARPNGITRIGAVWRIATLARIDHPKMPIALDENRIHVFKRQDINMGTAARLGGLRQSDIRAKKSAGAHQRASAQQAEERHHSLRNRNIHWATSFNDGLPHA